MKGDFLEGGTVKHVSCHMFMFEMSQRKHRNLYVSFEAGLVQLGLGNERVYSLGPSTWQHMMNCWHAFQQLHFSPQIPAHVINQQVKMTFKRVRFMEERNVSTGSNLKKLDSCLCALKCRGLFMHFLKSQPHLMIWTWTTIISCWSKHNKVHQSVSLTVSEKLQ